MQLFWDSNGLAKLPDLLYYVNNLKNLEDPYQDLLIFHISVFLSLFTKKVNLTFKWDKVFKNGPSKIWSGMVCLDPNVGKVSHKIEDNVKEPQNRVAYKISWPEA